MYWQKHSGPRGVRYYFIYFDTVLHKNVRLKSKETAHIRSDEEADLFIQKFDSTYDAMRLRIENRRLWEIKYHAFKDLIDSYSLQRKEEAPNSWESDRSNLANYILPFFLEQKQMNNINLWSDAFEEFRDYLMTVKPLHYREGQQTISYSTKNNVIKCLNSFLKYLHRRHKIDKPETCRYFPKNKVRLKDEQSVIPEDVQQCIRESLKSKSELQADFFQVLLKTGMRLNEALGLSIADVFNGPPNEIISLLPRHLSVEGFIVLESQPTLKTIRNGEGHVLRKPLKGKGTISFENSRTIPIFEAETMNILIRRYNEQYELFQSKRFGVDPKNYLLFNGLTRFSVGAALRSAQKNLNLKTTFTPHDCRHTYSTWLAMESGGNFALCRTVLGHASMDMTVRYIHMNSKMQRALRMKNQLLKPLALHPERGSKSGPPTTKLKSLVSLFGDLAPGEENCGGMIRTK